MPGYRAGAESLECQAEKGRAMGAGEEKASSKKRSTKAINTGDQAMARPASQRARNTDGYMDEGLDDPRTSTSSIRISGSPTSSIPRVPQNPPVPVRSRQKATRELPPRTPRITTAAYPSPKKGFFQRLKGMHWLFMVGLGMAIALLLWMAGSSAVAWGTQRYNDVLYGTPRTFQIDAVVGHGEDSKENPSHFIAMNWNRQAVVLQFKAGDPTQSVSYVAPINIVNDNGEAPVLLSFKDVNKDEHVDMILTIQVQSPQYFVFINAPDEDKFRPSTSEDIIEM